MRVSTTVGEAKEETLPTKSVGFSFGGSGLNKRARGEGEGESENEDESPGAGQNGKWTRSGFWGGVEIQVNDKGKRQKKKKIKTEGRGLRMQAPKRPRQARTLKPRLDKRAGSGR